MGDNPPAHHISAAKKILEASEYGGRKVIKMRALRIRPNGNGPWGWEYVGVENLDILVV